LRGVFIEGGRKGKGGGEGRVEGREGWWRGGKGGGQGRVEGTEGSRRRAGLCQRN